MKKKILVGLLVLGILFSTLAVASFGSKAKVNIAQEKDPYVFIVTPKNV